MGTRKLYDCYLEDILYKYNVLKMSALNIGKCYGVSDTAIFRFFKRHGEVVRSRCKSVYPEYESVQKCKKLYSCGNEGVQLSIECAYNPHTDNVCISHGIYKQHCWNGGAATNRTCTLYLGVIVAERVLAEVFKNVERMPPRNPGYDFICGQGYKIDVKSACMRISRGSWEFCIRRNTIADYFLFLAFDNRDDLNPVHLWLIPGAEVNHLATATISKGTINKWRQYEMTSKLDQVISRCNVMRS